MKLDTLEIGKDAVVASVASDDQALRQHILDMGLTPGTEVTMMKYAPMGDPLEIRLRGYEVTLRKDDAARIELVDIHDTDTGPRANAAIGTTEHPALGEGTYSPRAAKTAVPEGAPLHFALAGNQNCGKTTLFNQLTGSNQHVGNFPGVTVDRKDGTIRNHPEASVTDLPGPGGRQVRHGGGSARHLLPLPLLHGGDCRPGLHRGGAARRHHRHH